MKTYKFKDIPQYTRCASYMVNVSWDMLEQHISQEHKASYGAVLDLDPDFQRAHVWTEEQQRKYVEFVLRGGNSSRDLYFNCVGWMNSFKGPYVLVDGKQRLESARKFLRNELTIFHDKFLGNKKPLLYKDFSDKLGLWPNFNWHVNDLKTRAEVLQWYCDLNAGGVVHTTEEINRVKQLLEEELKNGK